MLGDEANEPALKGWNDTDGRRGLAGAVSDRSEDLEPIDRRWLAGAVDDGGVSSEGPSSRIARMADRGLVPGAAPPVL